jgi:hypothetical protein
MHESLRLSVRELSRLDDPIVVAAFWGWSDGTGSAMATARYLRNEWNATELASIDPDEFYDLTVARPVIRRRGTEVTVRWPGTRFHVAHPTGSTRDVVFIVGREPALRWQQYANLVAEFMEEIGARRFIAMGTRPALVPHTRPAPVMLSDADPEIEEMFGLKSEASRYEGPTGIQSVVIAHLRSLGMQTGRLSALVPNYVSGAPNPRAIIALIECLDRALGTRTDLEPVRAEIPGFDDQVIETSEDPSGMRANVERLEEQFDATSPAPETAEDLPSTDEMLQGIEELLRQHRGDGGGTDSPERT